MAQLQRTLIQSQITDHNISTIEPYSNLLMNETNIFTLNPLNQHSKNQNSGIIHLFLIKFYRN